MKFNTPTSRDNCCLRDAPPKIGDPVRHKATGHPIGQLEGISTDGCYVWVKLGDYDYDTYLSGSVEKIIEPRDPNIGDHVKWDITTSGGRGQIRAIDGGTAMIRTGTGYDCVALSWLRLDERAQVRK